MGSTGFLLAELGGLYKTIIQISPQYNADLNRQVAKFAK
jgi:hypothetical protein